MAHRAARPKERSPDTTRGRFSETRASLTEGTACVLDDGIPDAEPMVTSGLWGDSVKR